MQSWWAKVRGKDDPNTKIGEDQRSNGETFMALNGIDLTIYQGEAVGIIGSNGAGKSTLLKLLSKVTAPTEGEIDIYGRIASMLEVGTGFNGELTGRENVYMNGAILGMTRQEIDAKMEQIIEFSEVREFIDTPVKRYSSGMFVKLAFSVAAHLDSEIMIMDEVLAVGDMAFQKKCLTKMREAAKKDGRTVLYVSHNMATIRQLCGRCIVLDKGKVIYQGGVEESIKRYLGKTDDTANNVMNIEKKLRDPYNPDPLTRIERIVVDKEDAHFDYGEKLYFDLEINNDDDKARTVFIRTIMRAYSGDAVTMSATASGVQFESHQRKSVKLCMDISNCVPGKYYIDFVLFEMGELGANIRLDAITNLYSFDIDPSEKIYHGLQWNPEWWGYTCNGYLTIIE